MFLCEVYFEGTCLVDLSNVDVYAFMHVIDSCMIDMHALHRLIQNINHSFMVIVFHALLAITS